MNISELQLKESANVYVENEILIKWRGQGGLSLTEYSQFEDAMVGEIKLSDYQLETIKKLYNVIIETNKSIQFINFNGAVLKN
ncbi:hypothetical protein [Psychrobacillus phage Perkons]|nr:hypothetical protein [Psychrobacillus phage Perkons]